MLSGMCCEEKAKLQSVADYADKEKTLLLRRLCVRRGWGRGRRGFGGTR